MLHSTRSSTLYRQMQPESYVCGNMRVDRSCSLRRTEGANEKENAYSRPDSQSSHSRSVFAFHSMFHCTSVSKCFKLVLIDDP